MANNEIIGYVYEDKRTRFYQAKILIPGRKPVYRTTGETNRRAAHARLDVLIEAIKKEIGINSIPAMPLGITVAQFCQLPMEANPCGGLYIQYIKANRARTTVERISNILRTQIVPRFGAYAFDDVTPAMVETWKQERLLARDKATVKKELDTLSKMFRVAWKVYRLTSANPVSEVERPKLSKKKTRVPSPVEIQRVFEHAAQSHPDHFPILLTMYIHGTRIDEVRHLEPSDVLLDENKIAYRVKQGWSPKDAQERDGPLIEPLKTVILQWLNKHPNHR